MTTVRQLLRDQVDHHDIEFWITEKDYALSYLLKAIADTDDLGEALILKGGTALRKLYFRGYRFSEDLDYSTRVIGPVTDFDNKFHQAVQRAEELLQERGPFRIQHEPMSLREPHPGGQVSYIVRVLFPYQRTPACRLKVEITVDEPVVLEPARRSIIHDFPEELTGEVLVYQLQEVVAEKMRALLQSLVRMEERGWGTGRVPRDFFDLWYLLKHQDFPGDELTELVREKATHRGVEANDVGDFFHPSLLEMAKWQWEKQLRIFVPATPEAEVVLAETRSMVEELWR